MGSQPSAPRKLNSATPTRPKGRIMTLPTSPMPSKHSGEVLSAIYRCVRESAIPNFVPHLENTWELFEAGLKKANENSGFGEREYIGDGKFGNYRFTGFQELKDRALHFGSGAKELNLVHELYFPEEEYEPARNITLVGCVATNSVQYMAVELAVNAYNWTLVPTYRKMGKEALTSIFCQTKMNTFVLSNEFVPFYCEVASIAAHFPKIVILFDQLTKENKDALKDLGVSVHDFEDVCAIGKNNVLAPTPGTLKSVQALNFTSGTTGVPKGVMITHQMWIAVTINGLDVLGAKKLTPFSIDTTHYSYLPIAHIFEKMLIYFSLYCGARVGFGSGDPLTILQDLQLLKPTFMPTVPRIIRKLLDKVAAAVAKKSVLQQKCFQAALSLKLDNLKQKQIFKHAALDTLIFNKFYSLLGGNMKFVINGGAAIDQNSQEMFACIFCIRVASGYGMTETTGGAIVTDGLDQSHGHCGEPFPIVEARLESLPALGYSVLNCFPRGELLLRGPTMTPGYFMLPEDTTKLIDSEGWLHTGDVAQILPWNTFQIIDRASDFFKLSNGEFVSPEKLEAVYATSPYVSQIVVHSNKTKDRLIGVVVPDDDAVSCLSTTDCSSNGDEDNEIIRNAILTDLEARGKSADLKRCELLSDLLIAEEPFTLENGLLTPTLKMKRQAAIGRFSWFFQEDTPITKALS